MFVNKYQINLSSIATGTTATTINIPISMEYQLVDQSELIERVFVDTEVEKSINPILDYEKVRFLPIDSNNVHINNIIYSINLDGNTNYGAIGFTDDDIKFEKNNFKESFVNLSFYDSDNALTQNLVNNITIFSRITYSDLLPNGQPKPANQIPLTFVLSNPILNPRGFSEGYHIYDYKNELKIGESKYLYMRGSFKNAKTGKATNLMVQNVASTIDNLVNLLYTRYRLTRTNTGYYYEIDSSYNNQTNVSYLTNNVNVSLYQIKAL